MFLCQADHHRLDNWLIDRFSCIPGDNEIGPGPALCIVLFYQEFHCLEWSEVQGVVQITLHQCAPGVEITHISQADTAFGICVSDAEGYFKEVGLPTLGVDMGIHRHIDGLPINDIDFPGASG